MNIIADLHTHTVLSGHAFSTVLENARVAREKGLKYMATTDHGPQMTGANPIHFHFVNQMILPEEIAGVRVYKGAEVNILDDQGGVDVPEKVFPGLEILLMGLHDVCIDEGDYHINTKRYLEVMEIGYPDIIVHADFGYFPTDYEKLVEKALATGTAIEINNSSLKGGIRKGSKENCLLLARLAGEAGCLVAINSDAHWCEDVGRLDLGIEVALEAGVKEERIINANEELLLKFLKERKEKRLKIYQERMKTGIVK